jgi:putative multiple sugar transport system permease protein
MEESKLKQFTSSLAANLKQYTMLIALIAVMAFFEVTTKYVLLVPQNVSNLIFQNAYVVILAVGMLLCILTGGNIDLSVGSVVGFIGALAGQMIIINKMNVYLAVALCLVAGILIGMWHGFWIAYISIPPFIVTLTGMLLFRGLTLVTLQGMTLSPFPAAYLNMSTGFFGDFFAVSGFNLTCMLVGVAAAFVFVIMQIFGRIHKVRKGYETGHFIGFLFKIIIIPAVILVIAYTLARYKGIPTVLLILCVIVLVYAYITNKTVAGRYLYALGGNQKAARLSGIDTKKVFFLAYTNMSFLAAVAGLVFAARLQSAAPTAGQSFELDAIGACFIGGASAYGGIGTVGGVLIGAMFMGVLNNGMSIVGLGSDWQQVVKGLVLLFAVAFDVISKKKTK